MLWIQEIVFSVIEFGIFLGLFFAIISLRCKLDRIMWRCDQIQEDIDDLNCNLIPDVEEKIDEMFLCLKINLYLYTNK